MESQPQETTPERGNDGENVGEESAELVAVSDIGPIEEEEDSDDSSTVTKFIGDLCSLKENDWLCPVPLEFFQHRTNLRGFREKVPYYKQALSLILDERLVGDYTETQLTRYKQIAVELYKLIHARYILTPEGMHCLYVQYQHEKFGHCPRVLCRKQAVLPVGLTNYVGKEGVKVFCGKCSEVYTPGPPQTLDGSAFGPNVPMLFYFNYPDLRPSVSVTKHIPKLFGFQIHESCYKMEEEVQNTEEAVSPNNSELAASQSSGQRTFGWYVAPEQE